MMKSFIFSVMMMMCISLPASAMTGADMVNNISASIETTFNQAKYAKDKTYALSMPLLEAALSNHSRYAEIRQRFMLSYLPTYRFDSSNDSDSPKLSPRLLWLLGRLVVAEEMHDGTNRRLVDYLARLLGNQLYSYMRAYVRVEGKDIAYLTWASAYLDIYHSMERDGVSAGRIDIGEWLPRLTETSDIVWAHVLHIYAAACRKGEGPYRRLHEMMLEATGYQTVSEALMQLPSDDNGYRGWATAMLLDAAARMGDSERYNELLANVSIDNNQTLDGKVLMSLFYARSKWAY